MKHASKNNRRQCNPRQCGLTTKRRLFAETLEPRLMLAGDALQNVSNPIDVNNDTTMSPLDALLVINAIANQSAPSTAAAEFVSESTADRFFLDVSGDGDVTPRDILRVLDALAAQGEDAGLSLNVQLPGGALGILTDVGTARDVTGTNVTDTDGATGDYTVSIGVTNNSTGISIGTVSLNQVDGLDFTIGDGTDDAAVDFTGSLSDINAAISTLSLTVNEFPAGFNVFRIVVSNGGREDVRSIPLIETTGGGGGDTNTIPYIEDTPLIINISDLTKNPGDQLVAINGFSIDSGSFPTEKDGLLSFAGGLENGTLTYTPSPGSHLNDSFTFDVRNADVVLQTFTASLPGQPVNNAPIFDSFPTDFSVNEDFRIKIPVFSIEDRDFNDRFDFTLSVQHGTLYVGGFGTTIENNGSSEIRFSGSKSDFDHIVGRMKYTPDPNFSGDDSITVSVEDSHGNSIEAPTNTVNVIPINDAPILVVPKTQSFFTDFDNHLSVVPQVIDVDGQPNIKMNLSLSGGTATAPSDLGQVNVSGSGADFLTFDGFEPDVLSAIAGTTFHFTDPGDQTLSITATDGDTENPLSATEAIRLSVTDESFLQVPNELTIGADGSINLTDIFIKPIPGIGSIDLAISAFNTDPNIFTFWGTTTLSTESGLTFFDGGNTSGNHFFNGTIDDINAAIKGLEVNVGNRFVGDQLQHDLTTSDNNFLQFNLSQDGVLFRQAAIRINVINGGANFVPNPDHATTDEDIPTTLDWSSNDHSSLTTVTNLLATINDQPLDLGSTVTLPSGATVTNNDQEISYTPAPNFFGDDTFIYTIVSGSIFASMAIVTVNPVNDAPVAIDDDIPLVYRGAPLTIDVLANDSSGPGEDDLDKIRITGVSNLTPSNSGTLTHDGSNVTFTPFADFFLPSNPEVSFTYQVADTSGKTADALAILNVLDRSADGPDVYIDVNEDAPLTPIDADLQLIGGAIVKINGTAVTSGDSVDVGDGTASLNNGMIEFQPDRDFFGETSFSYTVEDTMTVPTEPLNKTGLITVTVGPVNDPPITKPDPVFNADKNQPLTIDIDDLLGNDETGPANESDQTLTIVNIFGGNPQSTFRRNDDNTITYTPPTDFSGQDVFTYTIADDGLSGNSIDPQTATSTLTIDVQITPINDPPVNTIPGSQVIDEDNDLVFDPGDFSVADADGDVKIRVTLNSVHGLGTFFTATTPGVTVTNANSADVTLDGRLSDINTTLNTFIYRPNPDFNGTDTILFTSNDFIGDNPGSFDSDTVTITVNPINDAPVNTFPGPQSLFNTDTLQFPSGAFEVNDIDSDDIEVEVKVDPQAGGTLRFDPRPTDLNIVGNDTNTIQISGSISNLNSGLGSLVYDPFDTFVGTDALTFTTSDGQLTATDEVTITVAPPHVPFAANDFFEVDEDTSRTLPIFDNDIVPNPNANPPNRLTISSLNGGVVTGSISVSTDRGGTIRFDADTDSFIYTPQDDFFGTDTFTYTIESSPDPGQGESDPATVEIEVQPVNDGPTITVPDSQQIDEDTDLVFSGGAISVTDADGDVLTRVSLISVEGLGTIGTPVTPGVTVTNNNSGDVTLNGLVSNVNAALNIFAYQPNANVNGIDTIRFTSIDGDDPGLFFTGSFTISVDPVNDPPVITIPAPQAIFNTDTLQFGIGGFQVDDVDSDELEVEVKVDPQAGGTLRFDPRPTDLNIVGNDTTTIQISGSISNLNGGLGSLVYDPLDTFVGNDKLTFTTSDGQLTATDEVTITVAPPRVPFAANDFFQVDEDTTRTLPIFDNDIVPNPNASPPNRLTISSLNGDRVTGSISVSTDRGGTIRFDADTDSFIYTPKNDFSGRDTFTYTIESSPDPGQGETEPATVGITVQPINDAPVIVVPGAQSFFTDFDNRFSSSPAQFQLSDVDAGDEDVQVDLTIGDGTLTIGATNDVSVTPNPGGDNGIRITGSIDDINSAIASGLIYRTGTGGNKTLSATVNDLGNTGGGELTDTGTVTVDVEVLDFAPIDIIGRVFIDRNGNENNDANDPGIEGIQIMLQGIDELGDTVNETTLTDAKGDFAFPAVTPNAADQTFKMTSLFGPLFGTQGVEFDIDVSGGRVSEGPFLIPVKVEDLEPQFVPTFELFSSSQEPRFQSGIIVATVNSKQAFAYFDGDRWDTNRFSDPRLLLDPDGLSAVLTVTDSQAGDTRSANVSVQTGTLTYRGNGADRMYRVIGGSELLGLSANAVDAALTD